MTQGAKHGVRLLVAVLLAGLLAACGGENPNWLGKRYYNTTAYFNGMYNARVLYDEAEASWQANEELPAEGFIPLYELPGQAEGLAQTNLQACIEKCELLIYRKTKSELQDDAYLLLGQCRYHLGELPQAMQVFEFIPLKFEGEDRVPDALLWQAQVHVARGNLFVARKVLDRIFELPEPDDEVVAGATSLLASLLAQDGQLAEATGLLSRNLERFKKRRQRSRAHYLLGQLYQAQQQYARATAQFAEAGKLAGNPAFAFKAELAELAVAIDQRPASSGNNDTREGLQALLKKSKYRAYQDQAYYQLGRLEAKQRRYAQATEAFKAGLAADEAQLQGNARQRSLTYYTLARLYFDQLDDIDNAQVYMDSAARVAQPGYANYAEINRLASVLGRYAQAKYTAQRADSLLILASMPQRAIDDRITERIAAEEQARQEEAARQAEEERRQRAIEAAEARQRTNFQRTQLNQQIRGGGPQVGSGFYFDDPNQVARGKDAFRQVWGRRQNTDNWRVAALVQFTGFANNTTTDQGEGGTAADSAQASNAPQAIDPAARREQLLAVIPQSDSAKATLELQGLEAKVAWAGLLHSDLNRPEEAKKLYQEVIYQAPESAYAARAYYALYRMAREENRFGEAAQYAERIYDDFGTTEYARLVRQTENPELAELEAGGEDNAYNAAYGLYKAEDYSTVVSFCTYQLELGQEPPRAAQFWYLKGLAELQLRDTTAARSSLQQVVQNFPNTEQAPVATRTLEYLDKPPAGFLAFEKQQDASEASGRTRDEGNSEATEVEFRLGRAKNDRILLVLLVDQDKVPARALLEKVNAFVQRHAPDGNIAVNLFQYQQQHLAYMTPFYTFKAANDFSKALIAAEEVKEYITVPELQVLWTTPVNFRQAFTRRRFEAYSVWLKNNKDTLLRAEEDGQYD